MLYYSLATLHSWHARARE